MKRVVLVFSVLLGLMCGFSSLAYAKNTADIVSAEEPEKILSVIKEFGTAELLKDSDGDPMIRGKVYGISYSVFFLGCKENKNCTNISFLTAWSDFSGSEKAVQDWGYRRGYVQTAVIDGAARLKMRVNLKKGVTMDNLRETFGLWRFHMVDFGDNIVNKK